MTTRVCIFLAALLIICLGAVVGYSVWNKPFKNSLQGKSVKVSATQIFTDFSTNEAAAQKKYVPEKMDDKAVEITGEIRDTGKNEDGEFYYNLKTNDEMFGVKCIMNKGEQIADAKAGKKITLRGFCDGFNMDVVVNRCRPVN